MAKERLEEVSSRLYDDLIKQAHLIDVVQGSSIIRNCLFLDYDRQAYRFKDQKGDEHIISREKVTDLIVRKAITLSGNPSEVVYKRGIGELSVDGKSVRLSRRSRKIFDAFSYRCLGSIVRREALIPLFHENTDPRNAVNDGIRTLRKELVAIPLDVHTVAGQGYTLRSTYSPPIPLKIEE